MAKQVVDTDMIIDAANSLNTINSTINSEFDTMQRTAKLLDNDWKGAASEVTRTLMYETFQINPVRSIVLQLYVNMLSRRVAPEYIATENANIKLADLFR